MECWEILRWGKFLELVVGIFFGNKNAAHIAGDKKMGC